MKNLKKIFNGFRTIPWTLNILAGVFFLLTKYKTLVMARNKNLLTGNNDRESTPSHERSRVSQNSPDLPTSPLDTPGQVSIYLSVHLSCLSIYLSINVTYFPKRQLPKGNFLSGNFPNVQFPKRQLPLHIIASCNRTP